MSRAWLTLGLLALAGCPRAQGVTDAGPAPTSTSTQLVRDAEGALQAGQLDDAVRAARDAAAGASSAVTQNLLGRALLARFQRAHRAEDAEGARAAFLRAVELDARFWPALENLGALAELGGHPDEAATFYRRVLEAEPQHPQRARFEALFAQLPPPSR